jgi:hypothetical protein
LNFLKLRQLNITIMGTNVQVKDVLHKLRSSGNIVKVAEYRKVEWLKNKQTFVGQMRTICRCAFKVLI